ncbi:MFS transporter [Frankia sp. CNm7]|uniref:MFS transporter n=1 Tax=Frankia nepalensis TaxID=1836974 RepID=A0A937R7F7_9ACTN|nr:MFS transporter [Frankia nepalensis]MBL7501285.1 MFS transporter [Frankia nepalensis]MBL7510132.1 MFS transporter [Frankia nepalensis]MBL7520297.1 MFS transporter [Frankia nepalensis]MBL7627093.1 MFS transporter [Frankia nepalensis]
MAGPSVLLPLRSSPFRRYLLGQLVSVPCSWAQVVALAWVVVELAPAAMGWVVALQFLPSLLLGPWFGAIADRYDRRWLLMAAEAGLGLTALAYAAVSLTGGLTLPVVCLLSALWGVINALDTPARRALVPMLVPPAQAPGAAALSGTVMLIGMTAGSGLGALMVTQVGVTATFTLNAASFLADVALLATIRVGPSPRLARAPRQIRDGFRYLWHTPRLRTPLLALSVVATFAFTFQVSVPIFMRASFDGGASLIGTAFTVSMAGSLVGTLVAAARGLPGRHTVARANLVMATAMIVTAAAPTVLVALISLTVAGVAWSFLLMSVIALLQTAEPAMMGRVMSLFALVLLGGTALGGPIASALAAAAGVRAPFALGALAAAVAVAIAWPGAVRPADRSSRHVTTADAG